MCCSWMSPPWLKCPPWGPASAGYSCSRGLFHLHSGCEFLCRWHLSRAQLSLEAQQVPESFGYWGLPKKSVCKSVAWGAAGIKLSKSTPFLEKCFWFVATGRGWADAGAPGEHCEAAPGHPTLPLRGPQGASTWQIVFPHLLLLRAQSPRQVAYSTLSLQGRSARSLLPRLCSCRGARDATVLPSVGLGMDGWDSPAPGGGGILLLPGLFLSASCFQPWLAAHSLSA